MSEVKAKMSGYVRAETLIPILAVQMLSIPGQPTRRALALLTEDGNLALGVTAESAQSIADLLSDAAREMRQAAVHHV
jgi:hypothetical protein